MNNLVTLLATSLFVHQPAFASPTTVSDILEEDIVCVHMTKSEALVFKSTAPQKIWKTMVDREAKIKSTKALELGYSEIKADTTAVNSIDSFTAKITDGYQLSGSFEPNSDNELSLEVSSTYLPEGNTNSFTDHYNCSVKKSMSSSNSKSQSPTTKVIDSTNSKPIDSVNRKPASPST